MKTQLITRDVALTLSLSLFLQPPRKIRAIALLKAAIKITESNDDDQGTGSEEEGKRREAVMREFVGEYGKGVRQENVRSKTKELTCTLPYALSMRPSVITASSEDCQDVTTACQIEDANVVMQGRTVRVQTVYHNKDIVAVRFRLSGRLFSYKTFN